MPPFLPPRLKTRTSSPPAQAAFIAEPRMTPMSWQVCSAGSFRMRLAEPGSSSGISTMSIHGQSVPELPL